jgi:hypothetical protein
LSVARKRSAGTERSTSPMYSSSAHLPNTRQCRRTKATSIPRTTDLACSSWTDEASDRIADAANSLTAPECPRWAAAGPSASRRRTTGREIQASTGGEVRGGRRSYSRRVRVVVECDEWGADLPAG